MKVQNIIVSLFAGVNGYLDKIDQSEIGRFEELWLDYMSKNHPEVGDEIAKELKISDDLMGKMHGCVETFLGENEFKPRMV